MICLFYRRVYSSLASDGGGGGVIYSIQFVYVQLIPSGLADHWLLLPIALFIDFSYISESTSCLNLSISLSLLKSDCIIGGVVDDDIGILIVFELTVLRLETTPHGLVFKSSGDKRRALVDCILVAAMTTTMMIEINLFIVGYYY